MTKSDATKPSSRSITDRLTNLARKRGVAFDSLLSSFLLERMAARLVTDSVLAKSLVFKGGYVSLRVYFSPRHTNDRDALLRKGKLGLVRERAIKALHADLGDGTWFLFEEAVDLETQGEYGGLRLSFRAGIGEPPKNPAKARKLNFDIGSGDAVTPGPVVTSIPVLLGEGDISWSVYPVETICSEKLHALLVRGKANSRSKDVFDLALFPPKCDVKSLRAALAATFEARGDALPSGIASVLRNLDTSLLKRGWKAAVTGIPDAPAFDDCFATVLELAAGLG